MTTIKLKTIISVPTEKCFDLTSDIDLQPKTTEKSSERAVAGKTSGLIEEEDFVREKLYILV